MDRSSPSSADVKRVYDSDKAWDERHNQWVAYFLLRPLSRRIAPKLVQAGVSATSVTLVALALGLALPAIAGLPTIAATVGVALASAFILLLDCVDGDVARVTGTTSRRGGYLDMIGDVLHRLMLYIAIGILAARQSGADYAPLLASLSAWLAMTARWCRMGLAAPNRDGDTVYARHRQTHFRFFDYLFFFFAGIDQLLPFAIITAGACETLPCLVGIVFGYSTLDFIVTQILVWRALK